MTGIAAVCSLRISSLSKLKRTRRTPVILHTLEGALEIEADGRTVVLKPGDVIHFGTRLPHAVRALEPSKLALYMLDRRERPKA